MKLLSIILNYKTADMTIRALETLLQELEGIPDSGVSVVDNDSQDGSVEKLERAIRERGWSARVELIASPVNGGFGAGNNIALRRNLESKDPADYYFLLNSDAFPDPGSIAKLVRFLDDHPHAGIAGSFLHGPDGDPHISAFRFPTVLSELEAGLGLGVVSKLLEDWIVPMPMPEQTTKVDWLAGASMMIRRQVLEDIGLFDETFFLYYEETDLCRRAALRGYPTYYVRESSVTHIGSVSTGMKNKTRRLPRFWFDSRRHYFRKNHGAAYLRAADIAWAAGFSLWRVRAALQRKPDTHPPHLLRDFVTYNFGLGYKD